MTWKGNFAEISILGSLFFTLESNITWNTQEQILENSSSGVAAIFSTIGEISEYAWMEVTIRNITTLLQNFTLSMQNSAVAAPTEQVTATFSIPAQSERKIYLPWVAGLRYFSLTGNGLWQIADWDMFFTPNVPPQISTAWGPTDGVAVATTGTVTNNGFSAAEVHSWTVLNGNTGGINYTITPIPVDLATWYQILCTLGFLTSITINTVVYVCRGTPRFTMNSAGFGNPSMSMANNSGASQTNLIAVSQLAFAAPSDAFINSIPAGV